MGVVYEAEQRVALKRRVALKVMKPGLDSKEVLARFEAERQALAVMQHPGIAKVLDAGATEEGRPYFVMELVDGESLKQYADGRKLSVEDRVRLLIEVCQAVQHAHLKGVIHRDLKPSNVLVTERDDAPSPKVIDFGVAKATGQRLTETTLVTGFGQALGTPAYMSPEQADASGLDVDTRTDVYSLGVTLYELLVGRLPQDPDELGFAGFMTKLLMRDSDPPTPSTRYDTLEGDTQQAIARFRRTDPRALRHEVKGDLDWIAMKAIEKDRERRYATANDLALDLERYLRDEPVLARPPSARYRAAKFVRRHRTGVLMTAAVAVLVIGSAVAVSVQAARIARERDRAEREAEKAGAVQGFVEDVLLAPDPFAPAAPGSDVTVVEALDASTLRLDSESAMPPESEAAVRNTIGIAYHQLGRYEHAKAQLTRALSLRRSVHGDEHPDVTATLLRLAATLTAKGELEAGDSLYRETLRLSRELPASPDSDVADALIGLGSVLTQTGELEAAENAVREAVEIRERTGTDSLALAEARGLLGELYYQRGDLTSAERTFRDVVAIRRSHLGESHPRTLEAVNNLAIVLDTQGDYETAERLYRSAVAGLREQLGDHDYTADAMQSLATLLDQRSDNAEPAVAAGLIAEAKELYFESLDMYRRLLSDDHPRVGTALENLGGYLCMRGDPERGLELLEEAIPIYERVHTAEDYRLHYARSTYGKCLTFAGEYQRAEQVLLDALAGVGTARGDEDAYTASVRRRVVALYEAWGRPDRAALYREDPTPPE
jgi:tetratricopeptide (TPR) repeat protein/tRNA A-37 threonylcarbamoyl transferase component Bud32